MIHTQEELLLKPKVDPESCRINLKFSRSLPNELRFVSLSLYHLMSPATRNLFK